jgi:hypothetical protein
VPDANHNRASSVCSLKDQIEQIFLTILKIPSQGIATKVCDLHHTRQFTIDKQGRFNDIVYVRPQSALSMETPH